MSSSHLLIVDDDKKLRQLLGQYLLRSGFVVTEAQDAEEAEELLRLFSYDAIVMDVMMPGKSGIDFLGYLRKKGLKTPVLMLTAMGDVADRISGLEAGADDYLSKPFDPKELELRLKNLLKNKIHIPEQISFGPFVYFSKIGILTKNGKNFALTTTESNLLKSLFDSMNQCVSREELARQTRTDSARTIDVQMKRLRKKIEENPKHPFWIQTVRGKGYKLVIQ